MSRLAQHGPETHSQSELGPPAAFIYSAGGPPQAGGSRHAERLAFLKFCDIRALPGVRSRACVTCVACVLAGVRSCRRVACACLVPVRARACAGVLVCVAVLRGVLAPASRWCVSRASWSRAGLHPSRADRGGLRCARVLAPARAFARLLRRSRSRSRAFLCVCLVCRCRVLSRGVCGFATRRGIGFVPTVKPTDLRTAERLCIVMVISYGNAAGNN